jgi:hypothetical protein
MPNSPQICTEIYSFPILLDVIYGLLSQTTSSLDKMLDSCISICYQTKSLINIEMAPATYAMLSLLSTLPPLTHAQMIAHIIFSIRLHLQAQIPHAFLCVNSNNGKLILRARYIQSILKYHNFDHIIPLDFFKYYDNFQDFSPDPSASFSLSIHSLPSD